MAVIDDLDAVAELCRASAKRTLDIMLALGPKPADATEALLWEQRTTRLQGQLNSLSALNSKLTAEAVVLGLASFEDELRTVGTVSRNARAAIERVREVSELLTKAAKVLDLGLALLAASAAPSPATVAAVVAAGDAVADGV